MEHGINSGTGIGAGSGMSGSGMSGTASISGGSISGSGISGGGGSTGSSGVISGSSGPMSELDRAPGAPTTTSMHQGLVMGPTTELEDPPGLYEKVRRWRVRVG